MTPKAIFLPLLPLYALAAVPLLGHAQSVEMARVVSSTPVITQVAVPRQVCTQSQVLMAAPKSGAGALVGAVAGGVIGSTLGGGSGRALATAVGAIGGAMVGDNIESAPAPVAYPTTNCSQVAGYENRVTAYHVVYEYAGKQYSAQLPENPGTHLPINVGPAIAPAPTVSAPTVLPPTVVTTPIYVGSAYPPPVSYAPPVSYSPPVWYGPPAVSFRWGYSSGWSGFSGHHQPKHHGHHGHHGNHGYRGHGDAHRGWR